VFFGAERVVGEVGGLGGYMFAGGCGLVCWAFRAIDALQGCVELGQGWRCRYLEALESNSWRRDLRLVCVTMDLNGGIKLQRCYEFLGILCW